MEQVTNRQRQEALILETLEEAEDALHAGKLPVAMRLIRHAITEQDRYVQEKALVRRIERNGLRAPSSIRSLDEYRKQMADSRPSA